MRIAIIAPFYTFADGYSLSHVVSDQARSLTYAGLDVEVWILKDSTKVGDGVGRGIDHLVKPVFGKDGIDQTIIQESERFRPEVIIAHDALLQHGYIDFAKAIHSLPTFGGVTWFHYLHSIVNPDETRSDETIARRSIPPGHYILYPNKCGIDAVAKFYDIHPSRIFTIPNVHDVRTWNYMSKEAVEIATTFTLIDRDIVQVYPFCTTRMADKGVDKVLAIFQALKDQGQDVCLVCCNSSANGPREKQAIDRIRSTAPRLDERDIVFTSQLKPEWELGLPSRAVSNLFSLSNVFIFPSKGEACPLVLAEARMAGCLCLLNEHTPAIMEYFQGGDLLGGFGSLNLIPHYKAISKREVRDNESGEIIGSDEIELSGEEAFQVVASQCAVKIRERLNDSPMNLAKRAAMRMHSWEAHAISLLEIFEICLSPSRTTLLG